MPLRDHPLTCAAPRIFYYPGARFDVALLIQSFVMVVIQVVLLKVALDNRPAPASKGGDGAVPFARANDGFWERARPYQFWQWRSPKPFVEPRRICFSGWWL
jgi:solute carrier family 66, member 2